MGKDKYIKLIIIIIIIIIIITTKVFLNNLLHKQTCSNLRGNKMNKEKQNKGKHNLLNDSQSIKIC